MITKPRMEDRNEQRYLGIRTQAPVQSLGQAIPQLLGEVFAWMEKRGLKPAGAPFMRYHVINMTGNMDFELGVPVASAVAGDGRVTAGVIPAGRYASLVYTGISNGFEGNKALIDWASANGIQWDRWDDANGDAFRSRVEFFLTDPADEPDQAKWQTEVAIRLADD